MVFIGTFARSSLFLAKIKGVFQVKDVDVMKAGEMATFLPSFSFVYFSDCLGTLLGGGKD